MADVKWTDAQTLAIESRGNILVSAAAGSGKTATLSAKIMHLLTTVPDVSLDDFLIVTYTNAAASELKERIGREISKAAAEKPELARHKRDVATAEICTIHSFCLRLVRRYFARLGLSPELSVADEVTANSLKKRAMETTTRDYLTGELKLHTTVDTDIFTIADTIGKTRDAMGLDAELLSLCDRLTSFGLGGDFLGECVEKLESYLDTDPADTPWGNVIRRHTLDSAEYYLVRLRGVMDGMKDSEKVVEKYMPAATALERYLERIISQADSYEKLREAVLSYEGEKLGTLTAKYKTEASEAFKALRAEIKKHFETVADRFFASSAADFADAAHRCADIDRGIFEILSTYGKRYDALKRERGILDFADLETFAEKLLVNGDGSFTDVAFEAGAKYKFVFIDEYQDTNYVQDRIFRAVSMNAEKFFVGDIKQSIYRFRGAEPKVFAGYRNAWGQDGASEETKKAIPEAGRSVFMSENFRCARPIIEFVNAVSRYMFPFGGIPFSESDCLVYGGVTEGETPVEVCLIDGSITRGEDDESVSEAEYTAERIWHLIKDEGVAPSDIAILLRNANNSGGKFERALADRGIPTSRSGGSAFEEESEVMLTLSILRAIDNPTRDIPLASAMMSSVFGFTLEELVTLRRAGGEVSLYIATQEYALGESDLAEKCRGFLRKLDDLRRAERGMTADSFIEHVYLELDLMSCPEVRGKLFGEKNLRTIHRLARSYESGVFGGLYGFLTYIDEKIESGALTSESKNSQSGVSILSIHKSKGLEYKVCFLCECGKRGSDKDERAGVLVDSELGIGMRLPDPSGLILCGNSIRDAIVLKMREENAKEEMRVLYVALTRARERLIVTAKVKKAPSEVLTAASLEDEADVCEYSVLAQKRMIDLILSATAKDSDLPVKFTTVEKGVELSSEKLDVVSAEEAAQEAKNSVDIAAAEEQISFVYPHAHLQTLPSKIAVSDLYPSVLDPEEAEGVLVLEENFDEEDDSEGESMPKPRFMTGGVDTSPAEKGISNHTFLQFADFAALRRGEIRDEMARLVEKRFITEKMASLISRPQIEKFGGSSLVERILASSKVLREFRFNLMLPASMFTTDDDLREKLDATEEKITVQGVFDCVFEDKDGKLVLVDYKTDGMTHEEFVNRELGRRKLRHRHTRQLTYYAAAVKELFGRLPDEVYIYSLPLGEAVPVEV